MKRHIFGDVRADTFSGAGTGLTAIPLGAFGAIAPSSVIISNDAGEMSSLAQLDAARGGTGADLSASTGGEARAVVNIDGTFANWGAIEPFGGAGTVASRDTAGALHSRDAFVCDAAGSPDTPAAREYAALRWDASAGIFRAEVAREGAGVLRDLHINAARVRVECAMSGAVAPTEPEDYIRRAELDAFASGISWQVAVLALTDAPDEPPALGDRYIASADVGALGWTRDRIYEWFAAGGAEPAAWRESAPEPGWACLILGGVTYPDQTVVYVAGPPAQWSPMGISIDHLDLLNRGTHTHAVIDTHINATAIDPHAGQDLRATADPIFSTLTLSRAVNPSVTWWIPGAFSRATTLAMSIDGVLRYTHADPDPTNASGLSMGAGWLEIAHLAPLAAATGIRIARTASASSAGVGALEIWSDADAAARALTIAREGVAAQATLDIMPASNALRINAPLGAHFTSRLGIGGASEDDVALALRGDAESIRLYAPGDASHASISASAAGDLAFSAAARATFAEEMPVRVRNIAPNDDANPTEDGALNIAGDAHTRGSARVDGGIRAGGALIFACVFDVQADADVAIDLSRPVGFPIDTDAVRDGWLDLRDDRPSSSCPQFNAATNLAAAYAVGSICFQYSPHYSGAPASLQVLFSLARSPAFHTQNLLEMTHATDGNLSVAITASDGAAIATIAHPYAPVLDEIAEILLIYDTRAGGESDLFINGTRVATVASAGARTAECEIIFIGISQSAPFTVRAEYRMRDFAIYEGRVLAPGAESYLHGTDARPSRFTPRSFVAPGRADVGAIRIGAGAEARVIHRVDPDPDFAEYSDERVPTQRAVALHMQDLSLATHDPHGFPETSWGASIGFDDATRTFTIGPTNEWGYIYYWRGMKYTLTAPASAQVPNESRFNVFWLTDGGDVEITHGIGSGVSSFATYPTIACVYWNAALGASTFISDQRHDASIGGTMRSRVFYGAGSAVYMSGFDPNDAAIGDGSQTRHSQIAITKGLYYDGDIWRYNQGITITQPWRVMYRLNGALARSDSPIAAFFDGTRICANNPLSTTALVPVPDGQYVLTHIFATGMITGIEYSPTIAYVGILAYETIDAARRNASTELALLRAFGVIMPNFLPIASVFFQCSAAYASAYRCRVVEDSAFGWFIDWRHISASGHSALPPPHSLLVGLTETDDHPQYARADGRAGETINLRNAGGFAAGISCAAATNALRFDNVSGAGYEFEATGDDGGAVAIASTVASTSASTGALTVAGGVGVGGAIHCAATIHCADAIYSTSSGTTDILAGAFRRIIPALDANRDVFGLRMGTGATDSTCDILYHYNGADDPTNSIDFRSQSGVTGAFSIRRASVLVTAATASTSPATGALIVAGGAGIGGAMNIAAGITASSATLTIAGGATALSIPSGNIATGGTASIGAASESIIFAALFVDTFAPELVKMGRARVQSSSAVITDEKLDLSDGTFRYVLYDFTGAVWSGFGNDGAISFKYTPTGHNNNMQTILTISSSIGLGVGDVIIVYRPSNGLLSLRMEGGDDGHTAIVDFSGVMDFVLGVEYEIMIAFHCEPVSGFVEMFADGVVIGSAFTEYGRGSGIGVIAIGNTNNTPADRPFFFMRDLCLFSSKIASVAYAAGSFSPRSIVAPGVARAGALVVTGGAHISGNSRLNDTRTRDLYIGDGNGDYRFARIGGGNSSGYWFGSYAALGEGMNFGYNGYYNAAGNWVWNGGPYWSSLMRLGYGRINMFLSPDADTPPTTAAMSIDHGNGTPRVEFHVRALSALAPTVATQVVRLQDMPASKLPISGSAVGTWTHDGTGGSPTAPAGTIYFSRVGDVITLSTNVSAMGKVTPEVNGIIRFSIQLASDYRPPNSNIHRVVYNWNTTAGAVQQFDLYVTTDGQIRMRSATYDYLNNQTIDIYPFSISYYRG
ncbi:MAG: hypothetical protein M0R66_04400 [Candidatus Omnitrophica bacterium]|nr:hypothetical protein [Candidatus Omnitrophota bacterium]